MQQDGMFTRTLVFLKTVMLIMLDTETPLYQRTRGVTDLDYESTESTSSQTGDEGMELEELDEIPRHSASEALTTVA